MPPRRPFLCLACGETDPENFYWEFDKRRGKAYPHKTICKACESAKKSRILRMQGGKTFTQKKDGHLRRIYGITLAQYFEMLLTNQQGLCLGCQTYYLDDPRWDTRMWPVDHDHRTGAVRGILCHSCNRVLGAAFDRPETLRRLAEYLEG